MPVPKWLVIARNEYRIRTSSIRKLRPYLLYVVAVLLGLFVVFAAPALISPVFEFFDVPAFLISIPALAFMQIVIFMFFFYFLLIPISNTLKDVQTAEYEIFLSSPVSSSDVLLGKFMGVMPFYAIGIVIVTGIFTAFLMPLGLDLLQVAVIILSFVLTFLSAIWIGTLIAAILKTRLSRSARGRDIGKALSLIIALPMIAIMYAIMGGGLVDALSNPNASGIAKAFLAIFPSSWGAELMVLFSSSPGNIGGIWFETLTRFGGIVLFFLGALWLGSKLADRAYSLETATFTPHTAKPTGPFYRTVKFIGGGKSFGTVLVSIFKDYGRRFENLSKVAYFVGLLVLIGVFFGNWHDPFESIVMGIFIFPFLAGFVMGEVTVRGKENFFIYRKAPHGESNLIKARLLQGWLIIVPIALVYSGITVIFATGITLLSWFATVGFMVLFVSAYVAFALGLFLLMPVFTDKPAELMLNVMIIMIVSMVLFFVSVFLFSGIWSMVAMLVMVWVLGTSFLYIGGLKLSSIE